MWGIKAKTTGRLLCSYQRHQATNILMHLPWLMLTKREADAVRQALVTPGWQTVKVEIEGVCK